MPFQIIFLIFKLQLHVPRELLMSKFEKKIKVNQQTIADMLKVSRVTVTKALQDHADIAVDTRKKVQQLADELGYIPNGIGRSLVTRKTNTIGVVLPKINHSFFSTGPLELWLPNMAPPVTSTAPYPAFSNKGP